MTPSPLRTASVLALLVLAQLAAIATAQPGAQPGVATPDGIINVFRWVVPYNGPSQIEAEVGNTIIFRWAQGIHNVYIHPTMNCDLTGAIEVGLEPGSEYTFTEADAGTEMFFSCDVGNGAHCMAGQFLTVFVSEGGTVPPTDPGTTPDTATGTSIATPDATNGIINVSTDAPVVVVNSNATNATLPLEATNATEASNATEAPTDAPVAPPTAAPVPAATEAPGASTTASSAESSPAAARTHGFSLALAVACLALFSVV